MGVGCSVLLQKLFKSMTADQIISHLDRVINGLYMKAQTVNDCLFTLNRAVLRQHLPSGGRVFLENRTINSSSELREGLEDWLLTRANGNYFKVAGAEVTARGSSSQNKEVSSGTVSRAKCYVCRKIGHRASECRSKDVGTQKGEVKMDSGRGRIAYTCYVCGNEGHKSFECPNKKPVKK